MPASRARVNRSQPVHLLEAIDNVDLRTGGPSRAVLDLCLVMTTRGSKVRLLARSGRDIPERWMDHENGAQGPLPRASVLNGSRWLPPGGQALAQVRKLVAEADLVHLHGVWEPFNLRVAAVAREAGVPYVVTLRGMLDDWSMAQRALKKRLYLAVAGKKYLEQAALVQCTAEAELYQSEKWFPNGRGVVLPNLLELAPFESLPGKQMALQRFPFLRDGRPWLVFLGRITPKKGIEYLVDAVHRLRQTGENVGAVVAGAAGSQSYLQQLTQRVLRAGLAEHVHFVGHLDGALKVALLEAGTATVVPTSQENFGFVFYESLAAGTPVVTTPLIDTAAELVSSGGCFLAEQDADDLAERLRDLLADRSALRAHGLRGREWIFREHSTDRLAARYQDMFDDALRRGMR